MIFISHRGNINGINEKLENNPMYLDSAISSGYDVEFDIWYINNKFWTGHDEPQHYIGLDWLVSRIKCLWIHCKNIDSVVYFKNQDHLPFNFFWHENDTLTLTSLNFVWAYPGKQPIEQSIAVLPERYDDNINKCAGICSDIIDTYRSKFYYDKNNYL